MKQVLERFDKHKIPLDTQVADIDHYNKRKSFTIDPVNWSGLPQYFDELHKRGMKTVMILDPALSVNEPDYPPTAEGIKDDVFITWPKGQSPDSAEIQNDIMLGYVNSSFFSSKHVLKDTHSINNLFQCWPENKVAYPDFFKESTKQWWQNQIMIHHKRIKFDGLWIVIKFFLNLS